MLQRPDDQDAAGRGGTRRDQTGLSRLTIGAAGALTIAAAWLTTQFLAPPFVAPIDSTNFEGVVVSRATPATIRIRNSDRWESARFVAVRSTCGCARVTDTPITIPPGSVHELPITIKLNAYEVESSATIYLMRTPEDTSPARISVTAEASSPFPGWLRLGGTFSECCQLMCGNCSMKATCTPDSLEPC